MDDNPYQPPRIPADKRHASRVLIPFSIAALVIGGAAIGLATLRPNTPLPLEYRVGFAAAVAGAIVLYGLMAFYMGYRSRT